MIVILHSLPIVVIRISVVIIYYRNIFCMLATLYVNRITLGGLLCEILLVFIKPLCSVEIFRVKLCCHSTTCYNSGILAMTG